MTTESQVAAYYVEAYSTILHSVIVWCQFTEIIGYLVARKKKKCFIVDTFCEFVDIASIIHNI